MLFQKVWLFVLYIFLHKYAHYFISFFFWKRHLNLYRDLLGFQCVRNEIFLKTFFTYICVCFSQRKSLVNSWTCFLLYFRISGNPITISICLKYHSLPQRSHDTKAYQITLSFVRITSNILNIHKWLQTNVLLRFVPPNELCKTSFYY